jgi:hypothetical protein
LAIELALGTLIWFPAIRHSIVAAGVLLHLGIDYAMDIPLFQWTMIAMMTTFVSADVYSRGAERLREWVRRLVGPATPLVFDGSNGAIARLIELVKALDVLGRMAPRGAGHIQGSSVSPVQSLDRALGGQELLIAGAEGRRRGGFDALRWVSWRLPLMWPVVWLFYLPGLSAVGATIYARLVSGAQFSGEPERQPVQRV